MLNNSIQVQGLQKSYKQLHVLNGVDLEVERGSIFALPMAPAKQRSPKSSPRC